MRNIINIFFFFVLLNIFCNGQGVWTQKANFPGDARADAMSFSIGMKGYIVAGEGTTLLLDVWGYDAVNNSWQQKSNFPGGVREQGISFNIGSKRYVGMGCCPPHNDFWEYDSQADLWTQKANLPSGRNAAIGFSIANKGYIGAGTNVGYLNDFWEYNPSSNTWIQKANIPGARSYAFGLSIGNKGYIGTGYDTTGGKQDDFWEYDTTANLWTQKTNFPGGQRIDIDGGHFVIGNYGYVGTGDNNTYQNDFWKYNPVSNNWTSIPNLSSFGRMGASNFSISGKGYVGLGYNSSGSKLNDLWEYTDTTLHEGVNEVANNTTIFNIYPNPSSGKFKVTSSKSQVTSMEVYNLYGEKTVAVAGGSGNQNQTTIDLTSQPDGIYFVRIVTEKGVTGKKIILAR